MVIGDSQEEVIIFCDTHMHHNIYIIIIKIGALFWSLLVICKEDGPNDNQNKRGRAAQIVANDHLDDPASYVPTATLPERKFCVFFELNMKS